MSANTLTAADFQMVWDEEHTFSFTESEDAQIMAYGHPDRVALAAEITEYDRICNAPFESYPTSPESVYQTYAILVEGGSGDEWCVRWGQEPTTPGAFPISVVSR